MCAILTQSTFHSYFRSEDDNDEISDHDINKLLILTQKTQLSSSQSSVGRPVKHDGHDRTGDWTTRVKMSQDLESVIDLGLQIYEENLWDHAPSRKSGERVFSLVEFKSLVEPGQNVSRIYNALGPWVLGILGYRFLSLKFLSISV